MIKYLEQQCLMSELQDIVTDLSPDVDHGLDQPGFAKTLGMHQQADVLASLSKHLQAAALAQQLQLPAATVQHFNKSHEDSAQDKPGSFQELLGSKQHLSGVTPQQLRQLHLPSRRGAQRSHAPLLPVLEQRLKQRAQAAAAAIAGPDPDAANQAVQKVKEAQADVSQLQQSNLQQLQQLHQEAAAYLGELDGVHAVLQELVGKCMLEVQPKMVQLSTEQHEAHMQQLTSKLHLMQGQMLADAYDAKQVEALTIISQEQEAMKQQLRSSIQQAQSELSQYTQLGDDFHSIVLEYGDTMAKIQEVDRLFEKFTELENEAMYY